MKGEKEIIPTTIFEDRQIRPWKQKYKKKLLVMGRGHENLIIRRRHDRQHALPFGMY